MIEWNRDFDVFQEEMRVGISRRQNERNGFVFVLKYENWRIQKYVKAYSI